MLILPAIDIRGGKCVRLVQGDFARMTKYGDDPVAMAWRWEAEGARMLHVVDLDGAKDGTSANLGAILKIVNTVGIPVQVGGGIRTREAAAALLNAGVDRVVLGTLAFEDAAGLRALVEEFDGRIVVALETKAGALVTRGWQQSAAGELLAAAREFEGLGVRRFLYTDVGRDGMLTEPNFDELGRLMQAVTAGVTASGGVSTAAAVRRLAAMGAEAAIVGKALYEGRVKLAEVNDVG